jgi:hypothetical protein
VCESRTTINPQVARSLAGAVPRSFWLDQPGAPEPLVLGTGAFRPLLRRIGNSVIPVWDYALMTEPLTAAQLASLGWKDRRGASDLGNQFHYFRLTRDDRILWGGYDAVYFNGGRIHEEQAQRPRTFAMLAEHFFATFPLDLPGKSDSERTRLALVTSKPLPFPPEPVRSAVVQLTRSSLARADRNEGRRDAWLRLPDRLGLGFDS